MAAGSKYTKKTVDTILEVLRAGGKDVRAITAANISSEAYYRWMKTYPEFSAAVEEAKAAYAETRKERLLELIKESEDLALNRFVEQLLGTRKRITRTTEQKTRRVNGKEIPVVDIVTTVTETDELPFPPLLNELAKMLAKYSGNTASTLRVIIDEAKPAEGFNEYEPGDEDL